MDFAYSADQQLLGESLARLLADRYGFDARKRILLAGGFSREIWSGFADSGFSACRSKRATAVSAGAPSRP